MQNLSLLESNSQPFIIDNDLSFNFNDHTKLNLTTFSSLTEALLHKSVFRRVFPFCRKLGDFFGRRSAEFCHDI